MNLLPNRIPTDPFEGVSIPAHLVLELAADVYEVEELAEKYGFTHEALKRIVANPVVHAQVVQKKAEIAGSGITFRLKTAVMAEEVMVKLYDKVLHDECNTDMMLDIGKWLAKLADLEPKPNAVPQSGPGFSISINIPQLGASPAQVIEIHQDPVEAPPIPDEESPEHVLKRLPKFLKRMAVMNDELKYEEEE
jgi:hypothetical protein